MATEKKFIQRALDSFAVKEFLDHYLSRAGVSRVSMQKTPIATRITIEVQRPGIVVGKRGTSINELAEVLKERFGIENPQIEVVEVAVPSLDPKLVAEKIARQVEVRGNVKQAARMALREIMDAGAIGAEIRLAGKLGGKGSKAKVITMRAGYLKKSGDLLRLVRDGRFIAYPKAGAIGVQVHILPPGTVLPDKVSIEKLLPKLEPKVEVKEETAQDAVEPVAEVPAAEAAEDASKPKKVSAKKLARQRGKKKGGEHGDAEDEGN